MDPQWKLPMRLHIRLVVLAALITSCANRCPDDGFSVPGTYGAVLDSHSTLGGPNCTGTDSFVMGMDVVTHFSNNSPGAAMCVAWIDRCGDFSETSFHSSGALGAGLANGEFFVTLTSGCAGRWEVSLRDLDRDHPMGTTPDGNNRPYLFTRGFIPNDTAACHTQFGAFTTGTGVVCADSWAVHLVTMGP